MNEVANIDNKEMRRLAALVIRQAINDLKMPSQRELAKNDIKKGGLSFWFDILNFDESGARWVRGLLREWENDKTERKTKRHLI